MMVNNENFYKYGEYTNYYMNDYNNNSKIKFVENYTVNSSKGLHGRNTTLVAKLANNYIEKGMEWGRIYDASGKSESAELHSVLQIMCLGIPSGSEVTVEALLPEEHREDFDRYMSTIFNLNENDEIGNELEEILGYK